MGKVSRAIEGERVGASTWGRAARDPFLVLISCLLSLRTKDVVTEAASARLFRLAGTLERLARLPIPVIEKAIYPVGFYKTKARTVRDVSQTLLEKFDGRVPDDIDTLLTLKGVGRKTANLVVTVGFGKPGICVDTHVHRISNRLGLVKTKSPEGTEWALRERLPRRYWIEWNDLLVAWGQHVCRPVSPWCSRCDVRLYCPRRGVTHCR